MSQPDEETREDPQSLAPVQIAVNSDEQDIAVMRGRRGLRLVIAGSVLVAAIAGGAVLLKSMDTRQAYARAADQLERTDSEQREAFTRCALPNVPRSQLSAASGLQGAIESASERAGKGYGKLLAKCTPLLESFDQAVQQIKAPADVTPKIDTVSKTASELGSAWLNYKEFLQRPGETYEHSQAVPMIEKIGAAWESYQTARVQAKESLSARL